jgi:hypothetical protein
MSPTIQQVRLEKSLLGTAIGGLLNEFHARNGCSVPQVRVQLFKTLDGSCRHVVEVEIEL